MDIKKTLKTLALSLAFAEGVVLLWMILTKNSELLIALIVLPCGMVGLVLPIMLIALIIDHFKKKRKQNETDIDDLLESIFDEDDEPSEPAPAPEVYRRQQAVKNTAATAAASYALGRTVTDALSHTKTAEKLGGGNLNAARYKEAQDRANNMMRERREKAEAERKKRWEEQEKEQKKKREEERKKRLG